MVDDIPCCDCLCGIYTAHPPPLLLLLMSLLGPCCLCCHLASTLQFGIIVTVVVAVAIVAVVALFAPVAVDLPLVIALVVIGTTVFAVAAALVPS
jgi:hypothetical protein